MSNGPALHSGLLAKATFFFFLLCAFVCAMAATSSAPVFAQTSNGHSVTLTWKASKSAVQGYNVYRGTKPGGPYVKINREVVRGLTYKDRDVKSGKTYYYVTRAVDASGEESVNSAEITATVP